MLRPSFLNIAWIVTLGAGALTSLHAFAAEGTHTGGGGGDIVCFNTSRTLSKVKAQGGKLANEDLTQIRSIEAYDLYEARLSRELRVTSPHLVFDLLSSETYPNNSEAQENYTAYIERLSKRFEKTIPIISELLKNGLAHRQNAEVSFADGVAQIDDADAVVDVPDVTRCALVTAAVQYTLGDQLFITFDRRLMSHPRNSQLSRAVLNLHENIYAVGRMERKHDSSRPTRMLLSVILQAKVQKNQEELLHYMGALGFEAPRAGIAAIRHAQSAIADLEKEKGRLGNEFDQSNSILFSKVMDAPESGANYEAERAIKNEWAVKYYALRANYQLSKTLEFWTQRRQVLSTELDGINASVLPEMDKMVARSNADNWHFSEYKQIYGIFFKEAVAVIGPFNESFPSARLDGPATLE